MNAKASGIPEKEERESPVRPLGLCAIKCAEKISAMIDTADSVEDVAALTKSLAFLINAMSSNPSNRWNGIRPTSPRM